MNAITALMVSQALADEHRRTAERRRRQPQHARATKAEPRRPMAWPFRLLRPSITRSGA
jgi:hypothetical protein